MNLKIQRLTAITLAAVLVGGSDYAQAKTVTDRRLAVQTTTTPAGAVRARIRLGLHHVGSATGKTRIAVQVHDAHGHSLGLLVAFSDQVTTRVHVRLTPSARQTLRTRGHLRATVLATVAGAVVGTLHITLTNGSPRPSPGLSR